MTLTQTASQARKAAAILAATSAEVKNCVLAAG